MKKAKEDRYGNFIGDGKFHHDYKVEEFPEFPQVSSRVQMADTTESVYVYYTNNDNGKSICCRFSWHMCNAVELGDMLNGNIATADEILFHLGLRHRTFVPDTRLIIGFYCVAYKKMSADIEEADLTLSEMYALGEGAVLSAYVGKRAKGSNRIITSSKVEKVEVTTTDRFGIKRTVGHYVYE